MPNPITQIILTAVDRTKAAFASAKAGIASLSDSARLVTGTLGSIFAGISVAAFVGQIKRAVDAMDDAAKGAKRAGTSVEAFSALSYAASQTGVADIEKTLINLSTSLKDAQSGTGAAAEAFKALKLDPRQFTDPADALDALADRFAELPDGVNKTALAADIFGKKLGPQMIPLLNEGREGIRAYRDEAAALGKVISTVSAEDAERFNDNLDKLKSAGEGLGINIAKDFLPGLTEMTNQMAEAAKQGGLLAAVSAGFKFSLGDFLTNESLSPIYRLAEAEKQLADLRKAGFSEDQKRVRQLRETIPLLKVLADEEQRVAKAKSAASEAAQEAGAAALAEAEKREEGAKALKESTDEQIRDAERLEDALRSAFSGSIKAEEDYLRQANKLRAEATQRTVGDDPEAQASAALDAIIAAQRLQRIAGSESLETVQDQAAALRDLAGQLDDVKIAEDLRRQANLAEAAALEKAAADERTRYEGLAEQQRLAADEAARLRASLENIGKETVIDIKPGAGVTQVKQDLTEIKHLIDYIKANPVQVTTRSGGGIDNIGNDILKHGRRL